MKKFLLSLTLLAGIYSATAQNLVPNGNFETITSCPSSFSQTTNAPPWRAYHGGTSDLLNVCGSPSVGVPSNTFGYQFPASGNGYAGGYAFSSVSSTSGYTEYLATTMSPMVIGATYEVSMSVSLSNLSGYGTNGMAMWFYDNGPTTSITGSASLTNTPQVFFLSYGNLTDTQNWVRLVATFTADSAYDNLVIGKFTPPSGLTTAVAGGPQSWAYYYVDSVVVRLASGINNLYADSLICAGDTFQVPYTLNSATLFTGTNVFSAQLSNSSGLFTSGTTIIGTRTATTAGSITCVVPTTITPGGNYRIRIISTSAVDSSAPNQRNISIGVTRPNVSNSSNAPVCTGQQLNLFATSTTTGVSYRWTGPAGFVSTIQNPTIASPTTANSGDYITTARLFGCLSRDTTTVSVSSASASTVSATAPTPICERDTLKLNATVGTIANSYSWSGPGGFVSAAKDTIRANAMPAMSGDYIFTAFYTGCSIRDTVTVLVKPLAANRTIGSNTPVCNGSSLILNGGSTSSGVNYTWNGPNSFVSTFTPAFVNNISAAGAGTYVLTYELNGCLTKDSLTVVVNPSPIAITASANTSVCERDTLFLSSTNSSTGVTWGWTGPGSFTASTQNTFRANASSTINGDYIVTATNSFNCTAKDTVTVSVRPLPANFSAGANGPLCQGATLFLTGNTTTSTGVSFNWAGPGSYNSTLQNPSISSVQPAQAGNYILTAALNGCSIKDTIFVQVTATPATPVASSNSPVCATKNINLSASTVAGAVYSWTGPGSFGASTQNTTRPAATTGMSGTYSVTASINNCPSLPGTVSVNVVPAPAVNIYPSPNDSICLGANVLFVATPSGAGSGLSYQWYKNNNPITGATGVNYNTTTAVDLDEFFCVMTAPNACSDPFVDSSIAIKMRVLPWLAPSVSIVASPTGTVPSGTTINFTATPTNGGLTPTYQWKRNSANVIGALSSVWGAPTLSNGDEICVEMTSSYLCPNPKTAKSNCIKVSIETTGIKGTWMGKQPAIYPNPVKDLLMIEGIATGTTIQLTDVAGRTLIRKTSISNNETLNMQNIIPGNYILLIDDNKGNNIRVKITKE